MCGFISVFDRSGVLRFREDEIREAGDTLTHRGPDDAGHFYEKAYGTCFRRLSILDTSAAGHQPMFSDDGDMVVSYNGEIYNYVELREELIRRGYTFRTRSDTEVLLKTYQAFGEKCLQRFRGMFSFALYNRRTEELFVTRDRLGIKPLYIYEANGQFIFASEIKAILKLMPQASSIDQRSVFKYLARGWVDDSTDTFFAEIKSVAPGTFLKVSRDGVRREKYWDLAVAGEGRKFEPEAFQSTFTETVKLHLRSDVGWAATLSGGMDSSSIVAAAASLLGKDNPPLAFSVTPPETVDESFWINRTVEYTGIRHNYLEIDFSGLPMLVDRVLVDHDEPFHSSSCLYQYLLRERISQLGFKVLLVGEGGDEVLGGYKRLFWPYLHELKRAGRMDELERALMGAGEFLGLAPDEQRAGLVKYEKLLESRSSGQENLSAYRVLSPELVQDYQQVKDEPAYPEQVVEGANQFFAHLKQHLFQRDVPYVLRMEDRNSMAHGVEARVPLLDHRFIEEVFSYDFGEFMAAGVNKSMMRRAMKGLLPDEVIERKSKSPRPGNDAHLVYGHLRPHFDLKTDWLGRSAQEIFEQDCNSRSEQNAEFWFRYYLLTRWIETKT